MTSSAPETPPGRLTDDRAHESHKVGTVSTDLVRVEWSHGSTVLPHGLAACRDLLTEAGFTFGQLQEAVYGLGVHR